MRERTNGLEGGHQPSHRATGRRGHQRPLYGASSLPIRRWRKAVGRRRDGALIPHPLLPILGLFVTHTSHAWTGGAKPRNWRKTDQIGFSRG